MSRTKRPLNRCCSCSYLWHPRGADLAARCPRCDSPRVEIAPRGDPYWGIARPHEPEQLPEERGEVPRHLVEEVEDEREEGPPLPSQWPVVLAVFALFLAVPLLLAFCLYHWRR